MSFPPSALHAEEDFRFCFLTTYERIWQDVGLPPFLDEVASGPSDSLMQEAIDRVL